MKQFRKENEQIICEECSHKCNSKNSLSRHTNSVHNGFKNYYDKWIKEIQDGKCKICFKETTFISGQKGYQNTCSHECTQKLRRQTNLIKYGFEMAQESKKVKEKAKETNIKKYGTISPTQNDIIKEKVKLTTKATTGFDCNFKNRKLMKDSLALKYGSGIENISQLKETQDKIKHNYINKYGVEHPSKLKSFQEHNKQVRLKKYGVEHCLQNIDIHNKQQKSSYYSKKYKDTDINYRASYELDFLEHFYDKYPDIQNGPSIKYFYEKERIYFPDFYIPSLNLIIECKNSYLAKIDKDKIAAKEKATITNGFKYILIVNKNYNDSPTV